MEEIERGRGRVSDYRLRPPDRLRTLYAANKADCVGYVYTTFNLSHGAIECVAIKVGTF